MLGCQQSNEDTSWSRIRAGHLGAEESQAQPLPLGGTAEAGKIAAKGSKGHSVSTKEETMALASVSPPVMRVVMIVLVSCGCLRS